MNETRFSDRLKALKPFRVMEIAEQARFLENQGRSIVHFEIGELDFPTAPPIAVSYTHLTLPTILRL